MSTVFVIQGGELIEMVESGYLSEAQLQDLLERYPKLIPGDQINTSEPRRWLLVRREVGVPDDEGASDRWAVDHVFLDQDAVPTLIEVKRSENTEIRRRIVGQMLDYAANVVAFWPVERIRSEFEARCEKAGLDPYEELLNVIGEENPEDYWEQVKTNLQAGKIRLLFVADAIPSELRRIVEFLNEQMDPAEVLAVQVRRFAKDEVQTLVPQVVGAVSRKPPRPLGEWDKASFLRKLDYVAGHDAVTVATRFLAWSKDKLPRLAFGKGKEEGSMWAVLDHAGNNYYPVGLWTSGTVQVVFGQIAKNPPFDAEERRLAFLREINKIPVVSLPDECVNGKYPVIKMELLVEEEPMKCFLQALDWYVEQVKGYSPDE